MSLVIGWICVFFQVPSPRVPNFVEVEYIILDFVTKNSVTKAEFSLFRSEGQIISKGLLVSSNSPKKWTNEFIFTTTTNSFVHFLGEFEDTKKSFRNCLTFMKKSDRRELGHRMIDFPYCSRSLLTNTIQKGSNFDQMSAE